MADVEDLDRELGALRNSPPGSVARVVVLDRMRELVATILGSEVELARSRGETWSSIGAGLGLSRQATFQRYGTTKKLTKGVDMTTELMTTAPERVRTLVNHLAQGRFDAARDDFDETLTASLTAARLEQVWDDLARSVGEFQQFGTETSLVVDSHVVVEMQLEFEAGALTCRAAWALDGRLAGLFFLPVPE